VKLHRAHADLQEVSDFSVREAPTDQFQNLIFARGCPLSSMGVLTQYIAYLAKELGEYVVGNPKLTSCDANDRVNECARCIRM
jgi:hypothetical protein